MSQEQQEVFLMSYVENYNLYDEYLLTEKMSQRK